jgi:hypothetical protein
MTTTDSTETREEELLLRAVARMNAHVLGAVLGLLTGGALFAATMFLVLKGGPEPGAHLSLLSQYFFGYSVTVPGAFIGFAYAAVVGYVAGYAIGAIYNRLVSLKNP